MALRLLLLRLSSPAAAADGAALGRPGLRGGSLGGFALLVGEAGGLGTCLRLGLPLGLPQLRLAGVLTP
uniref:Uncharacterized protein n=1 Tax=Aegilops tauschii TaxID=37682 RepID=M8B6S9_AEGTA